MTCPEDFVDQDVLVPEIAVAERRPVATHTGIAEERVPPPDDGVVLGGAEQAPEQWQPFLAQRF